MVGPCSCGAARDEAPLIGPGTNLGSFQITAKIGQGGMGEVYRARDSRLGRDVAIKVLPPGFTEDPERVARFEREAQLLAQLQHANIASIYGLEEADGLMALVMELVEGPTLADRLEQGAIPLPESLEIARQIAAALEEAHEKGIVHRDLKPQNIKAPIDGQVKVLDFGLAKAMDPTGETMASQLAASPTLTLGATVQGMILGTAAYMAPEQAKGVSVDKRADIWAFGVVLLEMLTGKRPFAAATVPETLALVLTQAPDLDELPPATPTAIRQLLRRCLQAQPKERLRDIGDARIVIDEVLGGSVEVETIAVEPPPMRRRSGSWIPWLVAAGLGGLLLWQAWSSEPVQRASRRSVEVSVPRGHLMAEQGGLAFAPDGSAIVFSATDPAQGPQLWLRRLDAFDAVPLRGTEGGTLPFWSPDAQSIGFFSNDDHALYRYDLVTAEVTVLAATGDLGRGASWGEDGTILFAPNANSPIRRLHLGTGTIEDVTALDPELLDGSHRFPARLPDGRHFLFTVWTNHLATAASIGGVYVASLDGEMVRRLTPDMTQAIVAGRHSILVRREGALVALPFDLEKLEVTGGGEEVADSLLFSSSSGWMSASATPAGDLAFARATDGSGGRLTWLDRRGEPVGAMNSEGMNILYLAVAPDGVTFAVETASATGTNILVADERRQVLNRVSPDAIDSTGPVWSPDGRRIAFTTEAEGTLSVHLQAADGSQGSELLLNDPQRDFEAASWSSDGKFLVLTSNPKGDKRSDLWLYDFAEGEARELLADPSATLSQPSLSADGAWLAYVSDEAGNPEVFVRPFPALDRKWKVSQGGATQPSWRADSRELLFVALSDQSVFTVDLGASPKGLEVGVQQLLFKPSTPWLAFSPAPDHSRFLAGVIPADIRTEPIRVMLDWRRTPVGARP